LGLHNKKMDIYIQIEKALKEFLLKCEFVIDEMGASPRSIGDKVQEAITKNFPEICKGVATQLGMEFNFKTVFSRRAFEDVAFSVGDKYLAFDVKTRNVEAAFHMPNIKSVERFIHFYTSPKNVLVIVNADYQLNLECQAEPIIFKQITVAPIEHFVWNCLRFGKLGYGQIQIEPGKPIEINREQTRKIWMNAFFQKLISFYEEELEKSRAMIQWAQKCQKLWQEGKIDETSRLIRYIRESTAEYKTSKE